MMRPVTWWLAAGVFLAVAGCGDPDLWARYQAERSFWQANRRLARIQLQPQVAAPAEYDRAAAAFRVVTADYPAARWATPERVRTPYGRDIATLSGRAALALAHLDGLRDRNDAALEGYARAQTEFAVVPPVALEAALARGAILDGAGRRAEATEVYLGIVGQFPMVDPETGEPILPVMDAPLRVARDYARTGRTAAADSMLHEAERSYLAELELSRGRPAAADLWVRLARARMSARRVPGALDALRHALAEPRANVSELLLTMAAYCVDGGLPDSAFAYTAWVEREMGEADRFRALVLAARARELRGPADSALVAWGRVANVAPGGSEPAALARFRRGFIMESLGRWEQARTEYRSVVEENPGHELALDALSRIVHWHTSHHEKERARQEAHRALGDIDRMIATLTDERRIQRARTARAELLVAVEDWPPACDALHDLWERYPETPEGAGAAFRAAELIETQLRDRARALELYRDLADHAQLDADRRRAQDHRERLERLPGLTGPNSTMAFQMQIAIVTATAMLLAVIGLLATMRRGQWPVTLLFSAAFLSLAAFQAGAVAILRAVSPEAARDWAVYMAGVSALTSWLWLALSVVLARPKPLHQLRDAAAYLTVALILCVVLSVLAHSAYVVRTVEGAGSDAVIQLGGMGKIYLMYLVVAMVMVLMNLESMLRSAPASAQAWLRPMFFAIAIAIVADMLIVSGGLLLGGIRVSWMVNGAVPLFVAGIVTALSLARRRLSDMSVPVARPVIYYSSVSLTLAGMFLLSMAVLSKVLPVLTPEWKRFASIGFYLLVGSGGLVLTLSPRAHRAVKQFIDRNFYANRYDYRREWERVSRAITPTARPEDICQQIELLMRTVFETERMVVHLRDDRSGAFRRVYPMPGAADLAAGPRATHLSPDTDAIPADAPLVRELHRMRAPLVFQEAAQDLDLIPVMVEQRPLIRAMNAALCAPLHVGDELVGLLWLSEKRSDEDYSSEDAEFLGTMSRQLAAALWFARVADQLAEARQFESLNRLSTFVLHDIKNQVSGLTLVVENARRHMTDPEFQRDAMRVIERTAANLKELMGHVSGVGRPAIIQAGPSRVRDLIDDALSAVGFGADGNHHAIRLAVVYDGDDLVHVDRGQLVRVLTNLLTNAREATAAGGEIQLRAAVERDERGDPSRLILSVRDSGPGMSPEFIRDSLFRPFATTKPTGLGIGLVQCRGIVEAHGGSISVDSRPGRGTVFEVRVPAALPDGEAVLTAPLEEDRRG